MIFDAVCCVKCSTVSFAVAESCWLEFVYLYSLEMEKEMASHSNILAWKIQWIEEPGGLQTVGS